MVTRGGGTRRARQKKCEVGNKIPRNSLVKAFRVDKLIQKTTTTTKPTFTEGGGNQTHMKDGLWNPAVEGEEPLPPHNAHIQIYLLGSHPPEMRKEPPLHTPPSKF